MTCPQAQVIDSVVSVAKDTDESPRALQTAPSDDADSQTAVTEKTETVETCPDQVQHSPGPLPSQTENPNDSHPPQAESLQPDRPANPVSHPAQPIREVNHFLGSSFPVACSFRLLLACLYTASVKAWHHNFLSLFLININLIYKIFPNLLMSPEI